MKRVIIHIDRLTLTGYRFEDRHAIAAGLQQELARLLAEPGMAARLAAGGDGARLRLSAVHIGHSAKPEQIGVAAANGVARGLPR